MATYYWVGGTGTWSPTDSSRWASSSGGIPNAGYPTDLDTAIFDTASGSGSYTVTMTTNLHVSIWNISPPAGGAGTVTFTGFTAITVSQTMTATGGSAVSLSGITGSITFTMPYGFMTTGTLSLNGISLTGADVSIALPSSAKSLNIPSSLVCKNFLHYGGAVTVSSTDISVSQYIKFYATLTGSFDFSTSTLNTAYGIDCSAITVDSNLTINAGTHATLGAVNINLYYADKTFHGASYTWNNVSFISLFPSWYNSINFSSSCTIRNLTINPPTSSGYAFINLNKNLTVTNTLTITSADPLRRFCIRAGQGANATSNPRYAGQRTLTITGATVNINECEFREVAVVGGTITGNRLGDCGGNSGVTFTPRADKYAVAAGSWFSATVWSTSQGGAASSNNIPLPQDYVNITNSSFASGGTLAMGSDDVMVGNLVASSRTLPYNLAINTSSLWSYGSVSLGNCTTSSNQSIWYLSNPDAGTINFTTNGTVLTSAILCDAPSGSIAFLDPFVNTANTNVYGGAIMHFRGAVTFSYTPTLSGYTTDYTDDTQYKQLTVPNGEMNITGFTNVYDTWRVGYTWSCNASPLRLNVNSSVPTTIRHCRGSSDPTVTYKIDVICTGTGNAILYGNFNKFDYSRGGVSSGAIIQIGDNNNSFTGDVSIKSGVELRGSTMFLAPAGGTTIMLTATNINVTGTGITISRNSGDYTGKVKLGGDLTVSTFSISDSVFDSNGYTLNFTSVIFGYSNTKPRSVIFSGSTWKSGTSIVSFGVAYSNITFASDGKIVFRNTSTLNISTTAGVTMPRIELAGTGNVSFAGTATYHGLSNAISGPTITFQSGTFSTFNDISLIGDNINKRVNIQSSSTSVAWIYKKGGNVYLKYVSLTYIVGGGGADWFAYGSVAANSNGIRVTMLAQTPPSVLMAFM
mgnify:CR=1 FL=1